MRNETEVERLRANLAKAQRWMGHTAFCVHRKEVAFNLGNESECNKCTCGLIEFLMIINKDVDSAAIAPPETDSNPVAPEMH